MSIIKYVSVPSKTLAASINGSSYAIQLSDILGWDANALTSANFGDLLWAVFRDPSNTRMEIMQLDPTTIASDQITVLKRGLDFSGGLTEIPANMLTWIKNDTIVELGSNPPQLLAQVVAISGNQTIDGVKTFTSVPVTTGGDPINPNDIPRKSYVDGLALGGLNINRVVVAGTAGATIVAGNLIYFDTTSRKWLLCDADTAAIVDNVMVGIAQGGGTVGNPITNGVLLFGLDSNQSGMTIGDVQYASNTAGAITNSSAQTTVVEVGIALTATTFYFEPRFMSLLTKKQRDALVGSSGIPSATNVFVTTNDTVGTGSLVRRNFVKNGGNGSDGALNVTSGTTTIDLGGSQFVVKNYTSVNISAGATLTFSNPHANGTVILLKSQGNVTIAGTITADGFGAINGTGGALTVNGIAGTGGTINYDLTLITAGTPGTAGSAGTGGAASAAITIPNTIAGKILRLFCGGGGGGGGGGANGTGTGGAGAAGGRGGAALYIECAGALNFSGTITSKGLAGSNGTAGVGGSSSSGGGGGGGGGGSVLILYETLTANSGTITVTGGLAGTSSNGGTGNSGGGGGGGGASISAGSAGNNGTASSNGRGGDGGAGGNGQSLVVNNTEFA